MMRFLMVCCLVASGASVASAEPVGLFEILRHEVNGGGTVQLFDGGPPRSDFIAGDFPEVGTLLFGAIDATGVGAGNSRVVASGSSTISDQSGSTGRFLIRAQLFVDYLGDGPNRPGGTAEGEWNSIVEFVMPVESAEWLFIFTQREASGFTQTSMVTVENVTTGETLVNIVEPLVFLSELTADVGDIIRVSAAYTASGTAPPDVSGFFDSGARVIMTLTIPEPGTVSFLLFGVSYSLLAFRRGGRMGFITSTEERI